LKNTEFIEFKFSYLALKLLGKNLYSNAWAALSELVANGLDAQATKVYIYIDMRNKRNSIIEVYDDGNGMSLDELSENYIQIGRNRRIDQGNSDSVMGRKGIGKLAALYLSKHYYVLTKKENEQMYIYEMDFSSEKEEDNNERPKMIAVSSLAVQNKEFMSYKKGTMIRMEDVDLKGYADISIESLKNILSDFFLIDSISNQTIFLKVITNDHDLKKLKFEKVIKSTPFKNMVKLVCFDEDTYRLLLKRMSNNVYKLPYKKHENHYYSNTTEVVFEKLKIHEYPVPNESNKWKKGNIKGWIGIHSSIEGKIARNNDSNYKKNKLYNPLKLRIYVRNKLSMDNFLPVINNTQAFVNYIEGEINYDILDDNDFPDIATTNRQNMDENDGRIIDLATEIKREITKLIQARQKISNEMKAQGDNLDEKSDKNAKDVLSKDLDIILNKKPGITTIEKDEIKTSMLKRIRGDTVKRKFLIFFSHSRKNKNIIDFFYYLLRYIGINENEMFYTSKDNQPEVQVRKNLEEISKKNIIDTNTVMFFYSTEDFTHSEYCMFEGGAAWATRTKEDFFISFDQYTNIPTYLKRGNEFLLEIKEDTDVLKGDMYNRIVETLNFLIMHINSGRSINLEDSVPLFEEVNFPDKVELRTGKVPHLNSRIILYWDTYIKSGVYDEAIKLGYVDPTLQMS
jgi:hypothetical protein